MTPERWKTVYDEYEVSSHGHIRRKSTGHFLTVQYPDRKKYGEVTLHNQKGQHTRNIARVVYEAFCGPLSLRETVRYLDGDKRNNRPENLSPSHLGHGTVARIQQKASLGAAMERRTDRLWDALMRECLPNTYHSIWQDGKVRVITSPPYATAPADDDAGVKDVVDEGDRECTAGVPVPASAGPGNDVLCPDGWGSGPELRDDQHVG